MERTCFFKILRNMVIIIALITAFLGGITSKARALKNVWNSSVYDVYEFNGNTLSAVRGEYMKGDGAGFVYTTGYDGTENGAVYMPSNKTLWFNENIDNFLVNAPTYTIILYIKQNVQAGFQSLIGYGGSAGNASRGFELTYRGDNGKWIIWYDGSNEGNATNNEGTNWNRINISFDGSRLYWSHNGTTLVNVSVTNPYNINSNITIGGSINGAPAVNMSLDRCIFTTEVTSGEILPVSVSELEVYDKADMEYFGKDMGN